MKQPLGVILAGGQATRMGGGDKARLALAGRCLLDFVRDRIAPQVADLAINANGDPARWADTHLQVIPDSVAGHPGPLAGVLAGLDWAADQGADHIVTVAGDTPFFPQDLVPQLLWASETQNQPIAMAATQDGAGGKIWRQPTFGLWPVALRGDLRAALAGGVRKVVVWADAHGVANAVFATQPYDPFFNVNTPADLDVAQQMVVA